MWKVLVIGVLAGAACLIGGCTNTIAEYSYDVHSTCGCASTDASKPCEGNTIVVNVKPSRTSYTSSVYTEAQFIWRFGSGGGEDVYCGQFANGDYWVAPKIGDSVELISVKGNGTITVDDDPVVEEIGLLSGANEYGNHEPANNVAARLPVSYRNVTSLVAAKQRNENKDGACGTRAIEGECVDAYNVVTVLPTVPDKAGSETLRPNITGKTKEILTWDDFDLTRLPNVNYLNGVDAAGLETIRQRWSHSTEIFGIRTYDQGIGYYFSEGARAFRSHIVHHDYASGMAEAFNSDLMVMFADDNTLAEKRKTLAAMLSFGLDIYHARYDPPDGVTRGWSSGAGQWNGQFLPPVFMAALRRDSAYATKLKEVGGSTHATNEWERGPSELRQINGPLPDGPFLWGDDPDLGPGFYEGAYWGDLLRSQCFEGAPKTWPGFTTCNMNFGAKTQLDPYGYIDGPANLPGWGYIEITAGVQRALVATMFLMPQVCDIVDYRPLVKYVDRMQTSGRRTAPDDCAAPDPRENPATCDTFRDHLTRTCVYYGDTWGPDPAHPGQCIKDGSGRGRFTTINGSPIAYKYTSPQVEANWATIRGNNSYCQ